MKNQSDKDISPQELLDKLKKQYAALTGPDGVKMREAVGATYEDVMEIKQDIFEMEILVARERAKLN